MTIPDPRPLIAHIVFRFDIGGLENGVVNLINGLPEDRYRHTVIALTEAGPFQQRIRRADVAVLAIGKRAGKDPAAYLRLYRLLRRLRPDIVHTRNVGTLDCAIVAALAGVPRRIHGEHGWDVHDPDGTVLKFIILRRICNIFVHYFVTVSRDLAEWLVAQVGIPRSKIHHICNGVDTARFRPATPDTGAGSRPVVVGSVLRFEPIKDPLNLVRAFQKARRRVSQDGIDLRLMIAGDGPLRAEALSLLESERDAASLPGARDDLPAWLQQLDLFVLGSKREGISNTILEAMATGLPVIATATGGNLELVVPDETGCLVPTSDSDALAEAIASYAVAPELRRRHGRAARARAESQHSLQRMLDEYGRLYDLTMRGAAA